MKECIKYVQNATENNVQNNRKVNGRLRHYFERLFFTFLTRLNKSTAWNLFILRSAFGYSLKLTMVTSFAS